jgi:hypothetical protein
MAKEDYIARTPKANSIKAKPAKVEKVLNEYGKGELHSGKPGPGKGPVVKSKKQAVAIALSEGRKATKKGKK